MNNVVRDTNGARSIGTQWTPDQDRSHLGEQLFCGWANSAIRHGSMISTVGWRQCILQ